MEPEFVAFLAYIACTVVLLSVLSVSAYKMGKWKKTTSFVRAVWRMKSVYGAVLVHIYDTSTDYVIVIAWSVMAFEEVTGRRDYENVNMLSFVVPSVFLIFVYRIVYTVRHWLIFRNSNAIKGIHSKADIVLVLLDLYIFVFVFQSFKEQYLSPCLLQRVCSHSPSHCVFFFCRGTWLQTGSC